PRTFQAFADYLKAASADAILILGDLFEVWVGDDARHEGFEGQCAQVLRSAASRRWIGFMPGNRDFLVGSDLLEACGLAALPDPTLLMAFGSCALLTHGDALCLADTAYQRFRREVRGKVWQQDFGARPLQERRALARRMREASELRKSVISAKDGADIDVPAALAMLEEARSSVLIHGH